ncbi:MAG: hypothetical protein ACI4XS_13410 [Bacillus sp. (in: firmicutes)]
MSEEDIVLIEEPHPYIHLQLDDFSSVFPNRGLYGCMENEGERNDLYCG